MRDKQTPKEDSQVRTLVRRLRRHIAGARRFVGSKTRGRFDVVASAGTRRAWGELGSWGQPTHVRKKEKKRTHACAVQMQRRAMLYTARQDRACTARTQ